MPSRDFAKFKRCVYADESDIDNATAALFELASLTSQCRIYFSNLWACCADWIKGRHTAFMTKGHDTNSFCEISVRLLKESIMSRTRARSLGHLLHVLTVDLDAYYSSRVLDFSSSRKNVSYLYYKSSLAFNNSQKIAADSCAKVNGYEHRFQCRSQSVPDKWHQIDMQIQVCSCDQGIVGKICKHLIAISRHFGLELFHLPPQTAASRQRLARVAHRSSEVISLYENLNEYKHLAPSLAADKIPRPAKSWLPMNLILSSSHRSYPMIVKQESKRLYNWQMPWLKVW